MKNSKINVLLMLASLCFSVLALSAEHGSDGSKFMYGAPPAPETIVSKSNWFVGPYNRWGLQHVREITPTTEISRGDGPVYPLVKNDLSIEDLTLPTIEGQKGTVNDWLKASYTDGFLVLHKGEIVSEVYMNNMTDKSYHNFFSMSKSFTGTLAGILEDRGQLDFKSKVSRYVPEMLGGAYGNATVRQLLDMTIGIKYSEDYDDPNADVYAYAAASNANVNPRRLALYDVLPKFKKQGNHGDKFHYVTANTDALGWVLQRASNRSLAELLTTEIWSKIGAERDAYVISDLNGTPWMGGGMNSTLRDAGRFGLMMLRKGNINNEQVVAEKFVADIQKNNIATGFPGISYRNQWWVNSSQGYYAAQGVAGQRIMVLPDLDLVVVKFSSWPALSGYHPKGRSYDARALNVIAQHFQKNPRS